MSCPYCDDKGTRDACPLCKRSRNPRFQITPEVVRDVNERNTPPPDNFDYFLQGVAERDSEKADRFADELRKAGASDSFLALCVRLVGGLFLVFLGWVFFN